MKLRDLLSVLPEFSQNQSSLAGPAISLDQEIVDLTQDARHCQPGSLFIAIQGHKLDGHQFLSQAKEKGAVAAIVQKEIQADLPTLRVENSRESLDLLASQFFSHPSRELFCFGVTGTNGKTSVTYMLEAVLTELQIPTGVMGTIDHHLRDKVWSSEMTTPGPVLLQSRLREMRDQGARAVAMEVSSHALDQHRCDGVSFNTAIFTNLTRDHLDYHKDMKDYFRSKQRLFTDLLWASTKKPHFAVINIDDSWGARLRVAGTAGLWTYGKRPSADFCFKVEESSYEGTRFSLNTPMGPFRAEIPLIGEHNVYNAVAAIAAAASVAVPPALSLKALATFKGVPGRLQKVPNEKGIHVFVDYAHSPDALENVLKALRAVDKKKETKIRTVFGCGGDRDAGKRPLMAQIAEKYSDYVTITSDNPRTEDPEKIIADITRGLADRGRAHVEADRKQAIQWSLDQAGPNEVVLIAGKGHEDYQIIGTEKHPFSDYRIAQEYLK